MDIDKLKNDLLTSQKTGTNSEILNRMYLWFEEKGFLNKLRAQVRKQMMSALKDNSTWDANKKNITSPKIQAINLLVADFLINQDHLFTLSVFITEVPLLGNIHEISNYVKHLDNNTQNMPVIKPGFQLNDVQDILEAIGILPNTDVMELTCQYYFNNKQSKIYSLLTCLFKAITTLRNNYSKDNAVQDNENCFKKSVKIENEHRLNSWLVSIEDILISFNLNEEQRSTLKNLLKKYHQNNYVQDTAMYRGQLKKLEKQNKELAQNVSDVEEILAAHFHSRDTNLLYQKEQIEFVTQQLRLEQQQLQQLINIFEEKEKSMLEKLHQSEDEYNKKLQDIENQKYKLHLKEMELLKREKILKEESMKRIEETKIVESSKVKLLQEQSVYLEKQLLEIKSKLENNPQRIESSLDREAVRKLQRENDELRDFTKVQRQKIEELSNRVSSLAKQIEKTHLIPSPTIDYQTKNVKKKLKFVDDCDKKKCGSQNMSSTTTDYSTTLLESDNLTEDDMIKEAHSKLKILEMNTAKVEQNLKNYKINYMQHNSDSKLIRINRKPYVNIHSNFSDDSDVGALKSNGNKINLRELANKIGYHRSIRRSLSQSFSENDTSPESLRSTRFQNNTNVTNISPIKLQSSNVNNKYRDSLINRQSSKMEPPVNKTNYDIDSPRQCISITESNTSKKLFLGNNFSKLNNIEIENLTGSIDNVEKDNHTTSPYESDCNKKGFTENNGLQNNDTNLHSSSQIKIIDSPPKSINTLQDNLHETNSSSTSRKEQESDQTISFGSNKTDKSSDFWP